MPSTGAIVLTLRTFETTWEADDATLPLNAIQVGISYDQATGERRELDLWFARLIGNDTAAVSGFSRAHLTPRDLVFVIDISNSMNDDSNYDEMIKAWLTNGSNYPGNIRLPAGSGQEKSCPCGR